MEKEKVEFRYAKRGDEALILHFIKELAVYEKMEDDVIATETLLAEWLFDKKKAEVIFVVVSGKEVGFALFFHNFSTFLGRAGIYLEDLFVDPEYRGHGYGKGLLRELARIALERECGRLEWSCLDWNTPTIDFYKSLGAERLDEWTTYRLAGVMLENMAKEGYIVREKMMREISYEWIRSGRRSIAVQIKEDGRVIVRSPYSMSRKQVERFLSEKENWILSHLKKVEETKNNRVIITDEMRRKGRLLAKKKITERVAYYADIMGVTYNRIAIREQKSRWGSCSLQGNLNFNWKLVLLPDEILDYVVVHELAHRKEMNHSGNFWHIVEKVLPKYREHRKYLKEQGKYFI